jgi:hypothetical protein
MKVIMGEKRKKECSMCEKSAKYVLADTFEYRCEDHKL